MDDSSRARLLRCLNDHEVYYGFRRVPDRDKRQAIASIRARIVGVQPGAHPPPPGFFGIEVDGIVKALTEPTGEIIQLVFNNDRKIHWNERDREGRLPAFCSFFRYECPRLYNDLVLARNENVRPVEGASESLTIKINGGDVDIPLFVKSDCVYLDGFIDAMVRVFPDTTKKPVSFQPSPLPPTISQSFPQIRRPMFAFEDLYHGLLHIDSRDSELRGTPRTSVGPSDYDSLNSGPTQLLQLFDELLSSRTNHEEFLILVGHWKHGGVPEDLVDINVQAMHFEHSYNQRRGGLRNRLVYVKAELDCIRHHMQGVCFSWLAAVRDYDSHDRDPCEAIRWLSIHVPPYGAPRHARSSPIPANCIRGRHNSGWKHMRVRNGF